MGQEINKLDIKLNKTKIYALFTLAIFVIITIVLGFTATLNILSFKQSYKESLVRSYALAGEETVDRIEYALKYGKSLERFFGMQDILSQVRDYLPEIDNVYLVLPDGKIVYDLNGSVKKTELEKEIFDDINEYSPEGETTKYKSVSSEGMQHIFIPIRTKNGDLGGNIDIMFSEEVIKSKINTYIHNLILWLLILSIASILLIIIIYRWVHKDKDILVINRRALMRIILCVLALSQIIFGYINYSMFKTGYIEITRETAAMASQIIKRNVETVINKGVTYGKLYNLDQYLKEISDSIPQIDNIRIVNSDRKALYATADENSFHSSESLNEYMTSVPIISDSKGISCTVNVVLSKSSINSNIRKILLDAVTIIAVSFFFMIEVTLLILTMIWRRFGQQIKEEKVSSISLIRPLAFIVYSVVFMTAAFVPVIMSLIYKPLGNLPKDIVLGLPISVEMLCGVLATIAAGYAIDKKGWKGSFVFGIVLFMAGTVMSGIVKDPLSFTSARGLTGAGFGIVVMAMRTLVISSGKSTGIADMNAGAVAGINCGVVTGAMMADRIGFEAVFYISAALAVIACVFAAKGIKNIRVRENSKIVSKASFVKFIFDKHVLSFLILILIPFSICSMFLNYYFPLYANDMGLSSSNVGRAFMLNGLCIVYLGPFLSKYFEEKFGNKISLITAVSLTAFSIITFAVFNNIAAAFIALLLMGVSDSFGISAQIGVFMNSRGVSKLGESKAIAYYSLVGKLGQMLGPITFGAVAFMGVTKGIGLIGIGVVILLVLFIAIFREQEDSCREIEL